MYRLAGARGAYSGAVSVYNGSVQGVRSSSWSERGSCTLCRRTALKVSHAADVSSRQQSTRTASVVQNFAKKKIKYKKQKKYVELLEVNDKSTTETKASINKLSAIHLSKLASSSVSLNQLHQLTTTKAKPPIEEEIDYELLRSVENKLLHGNKELDDDYCALIFTNQHISENSKFMNKEYLEMVKESYDNFRKSTIRDHRMTDLNSAINEGLNQEFHMEDILFEGSLKLPPTRSESRGSHDVFREILQQHRLSIVTERSNAAMEEDEMYEEILEEEMDPDMMNQTDINILGTEGKGLSINANKAKMKAQIKAKKKKNQEAKEMSMKVKADELSRLGREESLNKLLAAHLHLHCSLGLMEQGQQILQYYRTKATRYPDQPRVKETKIYNVLIQGFADQGNYQKTQEMLGWMRSDGITPNIQTHSAMLQSMELAQHQDKAALINQYVEEIKTQGVSLNDLFDKGKFLANQRDVLLRAVRRVSPGFEPVYTAPELDYVCPLLQRLNLDNLTAEERVQPSEVSGMLSVQELQARAEKQFENELRGYIEVANIELSGDPSPTILSYREKLAEAEAEWGAAVREAFTRNLATLKLQSSASNNAVTLYRYLTVISVDEVVDMLLAEVRRLADGSESYSPTIKALQHELGSLVYKRFQLQQYVKNGVMDKVRLLYRSYCEWYAGQSDLPPGLNSRQAWQMLTHQHREGACLDHEEYAWPNSVCADVGKFLYNIIVHDIKIDLNMFKRTAKQKKMPAVYKIHRPCGRSSRVEVKPHPQLARLCRGAAPPELRTRAPLAPLLCPAAPWVRAGRDVLGAYLLTPPPLVRMPPLVVAQWKLIEAAPPASLYPPLDSLNQLGAVPWRINTRILDLQLHVFRRGGSRELEMPRPPSALDTSEYPAGESRAAAFRRRLAISRARAEMYSLWCDMLYKLSLANHYRDEIFWLPHNMDFRGRVYACPPHLSQLGADPNRALLRFARDEPLGRHGLRWLKLHLVNLTGTMKKSTLDERLAYADSIMDKILDSADRPLEGRRWWTKSEEPWQTLACCMEIANAVRCDDPEEYRCGFPIHQDGSCNGLQHYAALGRDAGGAAAVNLDTLPAPQDVYNAVATKVEEMRQRDAAAGVKAAAALEGFVRRKVIKQTVMTTVYGVTRFGARLQIAKQLKDIDKFPKEHIWSCSSYLTGRTFESLSEMFTSTKLIQDWLTDCARAISGVCGESVSWVTPLGLPVVQPYHRRRGADTGVADTILLDQFVRPSLVKQKNAFPPNFIHSLDSSHMMLTSLFCRARGVQFVSVHDCFWTHPSTVDRMNKICREQFVALHSQPILDQLSDYLMQRFSYADVEVDGVPSPMLTSKRRVNNVLRAVPPRGDFRLDKVLQSVYFFS